MRKPLKSAAWSGIFIIFLAVIAGIFSVVFKDGAFGLGLASAAYLGIGIFSCLFLYGFVVLSKKFDATLLQVMSWIGIGLTIFWIILILVGNIVSIAGAQEMTGFSEPEIPDWSSVLLFLIFWIPFSLFLGANYVLFGVGLLKLKGRVKYANANAILNIVAGATLIIFVGLFVSMVAYGFEIAMMFWAAKKFER